MSGRTGLGVSVFDAGVSRLVEQYSHGHRVVISLSGGKDSTCCLELAVLAATATGRLPVEAITRDEEIMYPGTYEYLERVHDRPDVDLRWVVAHQPIVNAFNREQPYWWVMDKSIDPDDWVRKPPPYATEIADINIEALIAPWYFPPPPGRSLISVLGIRVTEAVGRLMGLHSAGGYMMGAKPRTGVRNCWPIYDWGDGDVWLAIQKHGWDYNQAYDVMNRHGVPARRLRIGPPTMSPAGGDQLKTVGCVAWPDWWDRVCRRLPSVRTYAQYGKRAVTPERRLGETWRECFQRTCIDHAPAWIAERATTYRNIMLQGHKAHSAVVSSDGEIVAPDDLPEVKPCFSCGRGQLGSWKQLTLAAYLGDPFSMKMRALPYVEPEFFRPGAGRWNGSPV